MSRATSRTVLGGTCLLAALTVWVASFAVYGAYDRCNASNGPIYAVGALAGILTAVGVWVLGDRRADIAVGVFAGLVVGVGVVILDGEANYRGCFDFF